jgi:CDP-diacylglycerol---glycerol-3-phosphate 3-phosphatidyltransferase
MNLPNTLSLLRILLAPVFMYMFLSSSVILVQLSFFVFTIAALTDWYDGWYARKYGFKTRWGQFLDPLADKILTSGALLCFFFVNLRDPGFFGTNEFIPAGILIGIIIFRDIALTLARSVSELRGKEFNTSMISKTKTFVQMTYIFLVLGFFVIALTFKDSTFGKTISSYLCSRWNYYLLLLITILTAASGVVYIFESNSKGTA